MSVCWRFDGPRCVCFTLAFAMAVAATLSSTARAAGPELTTPTTQSKTDADRDNGDKAKTPLSVGDPLASGIVELLPEEVASGFQRRHIEPQFARFRKYAAEKLDSTAGDRRTSEVTGNCRLKWYDHLLRNPLKAPAEAEEFTRLLHEAVLGGQEGLDLTLAAAGKKLDLDVPSPRKFNKVASPVAAIESVKQALTEAQVFYAAALAPLTRAEINRLAQGLYRSLTENGNVGHTLNDRGSGRQMCDLLEKLDREAMHRAARSLVPLASPQLLEQLAALPNEGDVKVDGVSGTVVQRISTPSGDIVIGGREKNTYQLDAMAGVNAVIDLGGDDAYYEGTCSLARPVLIVIDLDGDDAYRANKPGVQGSAVLGISMLLDRAGNDSYQAKNVAQGSCLGGAGILIDYAGNDTYLGVRRIQGQANRRAGNPDRPRGQRRLSRRDVGPGLWRPVGIRHA